MFGVSRLNSISRYIAATSRTAKTITALGNAKVSTAQSKFSGASAVFDGAGDYLSVGSNTDLLPWYSSNFTIEFWIRPVAMTTFQSTPGSTAISNGIGNMNPTGSGNYWSFGPLNNGSVRFFYYNGGDVSLTTSGVTLTTNTWYHLAFTHSSGTIKIYVDGTERASGTVSGTPQSGPAIPFTIGQYNNVSCNGYLDEIRISNTLRYTANFTAPTAAFTNDANTLLLIHADGTNASTTFIDDNGSRSKKGISAFGNAQVSTAQSKFGGASLLVDGSGDYLLGYESLITGTGDFTMELWFRPSATTAGVLYDQRTYNSGNYGQNSPVLFWENSTMIYYNGGNRITSSTLSLNTWYHISVSRSSGVSKMFINGTQAGSSFTDTINNPNTGYSAIGLNLAGLQTSYAGWIDEVRISNIARYTANFTAPTAAFTNDANTLLLLHMDGTNGSSVFLDDNA